MTRMDRMASFAGDRVIDLLGSQLVSRWRRRIFNRAASATAISSRLVSIMTSASELVHVQQTLEVAM
jgi:hypothetical protein